MVIKVSLIMRDSYLLLLAQLTPLVLVALKTEQNMAITLIYSLIMTQMLKLMVNANPSHTSPCT